MTQAPFSPIDPRAAEDAARYVRRRLAAILFAGYRLCQPIDDADSFTRLSRLRIEIIQPQILKFDGRMIWWTGDRVFIEFESVIEAARCAAGLRDAVAQMNQTLPDERRIAMQIGVHLGDVIVADSKIFGDDVNIAARLGALAKPGGVYVSESVHNQVADEADFEFEDLGPQSLADIARPIKVYRMAGAMADLSEDLLAACAEVLSSPPAFEERRAIAVLPFANFGGDPEQEFFADGITEDIISLLAGWRAFPVIARNSTFSYKGQTVDIKKVSEELGVRYVVQGSVRKSGHRVRVTAQLIRADTGHHIMAERYDRDLTDLFELQDEITHTIAGAIEPELLKFERERIAERPQHNEDAYELYQRGMFHHYRQNKADNAESQTYFRRALAIDPQYPQALAALSIALTTAAYLTWAENPERNYEESFNLARRAVALDPRYPNAHFALALACMYTHRPERTIAEFEEAIKLNPSFAAAHAVLGHMLTYVGRPEETIPLVEKGIRLSPNDPRLFIWLPALASAHYQLQHYEQAIDAGRRAWTLNRNLPVGLRYVVAGLAQLDRLDEARAALADLKKLDTDLAAFERVARRVFQDDAPVEHILDGLRKAGFK